MKKRNIITYLLLAVCFVLVAIGFNNATNNKVDNASNNSVESIELNK